MTKGDKRRKKERERDTLRERQRKETKIMRAEKYRSATQRYEQGGEQRNTRTIKTLQMSRIAKPPRAPSPPHRSVGRL